MFLPEQNQIWMLCIYLGSGLLFGCGQTLMHDMFVLIIASNKNKKMQQIAVFLLDFALMLGFGIFMFVLATILNYGVIRGFEVLAIILGVIVSKKFCSNLLASVGKKWYSFLEKQWRKSKRHEKVEKVSNR